MAILATDVKPGVEVKLPDGTLGHLLYGTARFAVTEDGQRFPLRDLNLPIHNAEARLTTRVGADRFQRTAIQISPENGATLDVLDHAGNLLMRVAFYEWKTGGGDVDIFPNAECHDAPKLRGQSLYFENGDRQNGPEGTATFAVNLAPITKEG